MLAQIQTREAGDEAAAAQEQLCAHGTVTKAHPKGTFPCRVRAHKGRGWLEKRCARFVVLRVGMSLQLGRGSGTHFPVSQVPFPPAVPNSRLLCSQIWETVCGELFQTVKVWMDGPCEFTLE